VILPPLVFPGLTYDFANVNRSEGFIRSALGMFETHSLAN